VKKTSKYLLNPGLST